MAMNLHGRANRLRRIDFIDAGARLCVRERAVAAMLDRQIESSRPWIERCGEIGFLDYETGRLTSLLQERRTTLS